MSAVFLRSLISHFQKRFLQSSAFHSAAPPFVASEASSSSSTVQFLVNSCGFQLESAVSASQTIQIDKKNLQNAQSVVELLKSHHFSSSQVADLILKRPNILQCGIDGNLRPKLEYLANKGFAGELLPSLILSNNQILFRSLDSQIKPAVEFFSGYLSIENFVSSTRRFGWLLTSDLKGKIKPNIEFLKKEGMSADSLGKLIYLQPKCITQNFNRTAYAVNALKNLGFEPSTTMFVHTIRVMLSLSKSTWEKKIGFMRSLGWGEEEILLAFRRNPFLLSCSEKKIRSVLDFCINTTKVELGTVIANPTIFNFAVEKTLRPRYRVLDVLKQKKLLTGDAKILSILTRNEKEFQSNYVVKYTDRAPGLLSMYLDSKKARTRDKARDKAGMSFFRPMNS